MRWRPAWRPPFDIVAQRNLLRLRMEGTPRSNCHPMRSESSSRSLPSSNSTVTLLKRIRSIILTKKLYKSVKV